MNMRVIYGLGGFVIGGLVSALITRNYLAGKYNEEIKSIREFYQKKEGDKVFSTETAKEEEFQNLRNRYFRMTEEYDDREDAIEDIDDEQTEEGVFEVLESQENWPAPLDVHGNEMTDLSQEERRFIHMGELASKEAQHKHQPFLIEFERFGEEPQYDPVTLIFYEGDGTLANSEEEPVEDPIMVAGEDFSDWWGWRSRSEDVVYVRNLRLGWDIEICRDPRTYAEAVMGMPMSEGEKIHRIEQAAIEKAGG